MCLGYDKLQHVSKKPMFVILIQNTLVTIADNTFTTTSQVAEILEDGT